MNEIDDQFLLICCYLREHRQRQNVALLTMCIWKLLWPMTKARVSFKKRQRDWIVDRSLQTIRAQILGKLVTMRVLDGIKVIDVGTVKSDVGNFKVLHLIKSRV